MSLAIPGIEENIAYGDRFYNDGHPDLRADDVLANPSFNGNDWRGELLKDDKRWLYGVEGPDLVRAWCGAQNNGEVLHG
jgi:type I restriction enzyme M protein